jgi:hypothetical protein
VEVTLVELKDIHLSDHVNRAMARQAEAEREKRAKIINAEGESLAAAGLDYASDIMMPPLCAAATQPAKPGRDRRGQKHHRRLPGPTDDHHRRSFLARETAAASPPLPPNCNKRTPVAAANGAPEPI